MNDSVISFGRFAFGIAMVYVFAITFLPVEPAAEKYVDRILMFLLGTAAASAVNYILGSSQGSSEKTKLLSAKPPAETVRNEN